MRKGGNEAHLTKRAPLIFIPPNVFSAKWRSDTYDLHRAKEPLIKV